MTVKMRFFARFRELLGTDIIAEPEDGTTIVAFIREIARKKKEGYDAIFDEQGNLREFVIVMRNGRRVEHEDTMVVLVMDGDEIAVFPPVAGG
jgi:molybdopterin synthase sulfur carrier subunit